MSRSASHRQQGATLTALAFATAVLLLALGTMYLATSRSNLDLIHSTRLQTEADYLAEGGIERGLEQLQAADRVGESKYELPNGVVELQVEAVEEPGATHQLTATATLDRTFKGEPVTAKRRVLVERRADGHVEVLRYYDR